MEKRPDWIDELLDHLAWKYPGFIVRQQLIDTRGWTPELIDEFMTADVYEKNPHNSSQVMRLYFLEKVYEIEASPRFKIRFFEKYRHKFDSDKYRYFKDRAQRLANHEAKKRRLRNRGTQRSAPVDRMDALRDMGLMP